MDQILKKYNCNLKSIDIKKDKQKKISSSELKKLIKLGEIEKVNKNLSKDYFINGKIVEGKKLGRELGYPTANLEYSKDIIIPKDGIYKTTSIIRGENFNSITSIGNNPTFNEKIKTIEMRVNSRMFDCFLNVFDLLLHLEIIMFLLLLNFLYFLSY